jgi:arylsulfatase A-like enzyme
MVKVEARARTRTIGTKPNVMIIMTDQQRADFLAGQGFGLDTMPFLESCKPRGVWFRSAYTSMPICTPARVGMLTGRYASANGIIANWPAPAPRFGRDLVSVLREQGYELALFGKNHSHVDPAAFDVTSLYDHTAGATRPDREAEDRAFDIWMTGVGHWVSPVANPFPVEAQYPARIVSDAIAWLAARRKSDRPWFAWVSVPEPHSPYQAPEPYFSLFPPESVPAPAAGPEALADKNYQWRYQYSAIKHYHPECDDAWRRCRASYCGMLRLIDDQLARLVGALEPELENTLVVFLSDHGDFCGDYGLYRKGLALPECCVRIPMFWFGGPVRPCQGEHPAFVQITDVFPTICEAAGAGIPAGVQGRSLLPLLAGEAWSEREFASAYVEHGVGGRALRATDAIEFGDPADTVFIDGVARTNFDGTRVASSGFRRAVIKGRWKLVYDLDFPLEMYDLERDPHELANLAGDPGLAGVRRELLDELLYWCVRLEDNQQVKRYTPVMPPHNWHR